MSEPNPYAPPADDESPSAPRKTKSKSKKDPRAWREGDTVVTRKDDARLPKRCVVCNQRVEGERIRRQFTWHPQWVFATFLISFIVYLIAAAVTRKSATVEHAVCEQHQARRRNGLTLVVCAIVGGILLVILGASSKEPLLLLFAVVAMFGLILAGSIMARTAYPTKIDDHHIWLKVGQPFLESVPYLED